MITNHFKQQIFKDFGLTCKEAEIVEYVYHLQTNKWIANLLRVQEGTIKFHLSNVYRKLGIKRRTELIIKIHERMQSHAS